MHFNHKNRRNITTQQQATSQLFITLCVLMHKIGVTTAMRDTLAGKPRCDPKCHQNSGCSERGGGKCDSYCVTGYGLDSSTYTCVGECDLIRVIISWYNSMHVSLQPTV